jgi:hypothetical protein
MSKEKIKDLEDGLFNHIQNSGLRRRDRTLEESLSEALANTTVKDAGVPNRGEPKKAEPESEWM